ncbi:MAG: 5-(carboxyamino)imidazole ribonucleotide synthase [Gemmatimonadales bacterium]
MILPGAVLGVLGGGQLGRMFTVRAREMGYRVIVLDPDLTSPAGAIANHHIAAEYDDEIALRELAERCSAITTEFENVPAEVLRWLADRVPVRPGPESVAIAQNRIVEKTYLRQHGLPTAAFEAIHGNGDLESAWAAVGAPALLKTARLGYDGKGQVAVNDPGTLAEAFVALRSQHCVLERRLSLESELSVVLARGVDGEVACFPAIENVHVNGILETSTVPARVSAAVAEAATELAVTLANQLDYTGVLAVELFVADGNQLFVNELAPRPHNSGHFTLDACVTDQFEQQVRSLCELPLGEPRLISPVTMINILGDLWSDGDPAWEDALSHPGVKLHLYGKHHARPGRKMGHLNCLAGTVESSFQLAHRAHGALRSRQAVTQA